MKKIKLKFRLFVGICAIMLLGTTYVSAREIGYYDMIMPRFGGVIKTDSLYKNTQSRGVNNNTFVGGNYNMNCMIYRGENKMTNKYSVGSGDRIYLNYKNPSDAEDSNLRLGAWTGITTYVKVQTTGSWSPDEY